MRFLLAIVLFVVAFATGGLGIAQRTILAPPDRVTSTLELSTEATVTVIDGAALNAFEGRQTIAIEGGVTAPGASPDDSEEPAEGESTDGESTEGETADGDATDGSDDAATDSEAAEGDASADDGEVVTETDAIADRSMRFLIQRPGEAGESIEVEPQVTVISDDATVLLEVRATVTVRTAVDAEMITLYSTSTGVVDVEGGTVSFERVE